MPLHKDYKEFVELLNTANVEYLIVGAFAFGYHARPRTTTDIDFFVRVSETNAARLAEVVRQFGFASLGLTATDFTSLDQTIQLGYRPVRIDILTSIECVTFDEAWASRVLDEVDGLPVALISRELLIRNKLAVARDQDLADAKILSRMEQRGK